MHRFRNRRDAGRVLATELSHDRSLAGADVVVLGLPRGGVPVAAEVARVLDAPLDAFPVRKLGVPGHEELAFGAVALGGTRVLNDDVVRMAHVDAGVIDAATQAELAELERRAVAYRGDRPPPDVADKTVVLVDDGLATGATMRAAVAAVQGAGARRVVVAVPVGAPESVERLEALADDVVCLQQPPGFTAVGIWYDDFTPTTDDEVRTALEPI